MIYLDYASTTKPSQEIIDLYTKSLSTWFVNSESLYGIGIQLSMKQEKSRKIISELFSVSPQDLIFTSGGSESNSLAVKGLAFGNRSRGNHLITSQIEHPSVMKAMCQLRDEFGFELTILEVDENGVVRVEDLKRSLREDTCLVSIMAINNEVGSIQPIEALGQVIKKYSKAIFHVDMVQLLGKHPLNLSFVDAASFSAHKIHGLKGSGLLYCKHHLKLLPLINGGSQEFGLRGGTSNASVNILLAKTIQHALASQPYEFDRITQLNQYLREKIQSLNHWVINSPESASPYILSISNLKLGSEIIMNVLASQSIFVSSRSTCSSKLETPSPVLSAMKKSDDIIHGVIRISLGNETSQQDLEKLITVLEEVNKHVISK